jgi:hypothetical protein
VGGEVLGQPVDPEPLETDPAAQHEKDVEVVAGEPLGVRVVAGSELLVVVQPGPVVGELLARGGQDGSAVTVRRAAESDGELTAEPLGRQRRGEPTGDLTLAGGGEVVDLPGREPRHNRFLT